ncbi:MAG TPA: YHS domain-containing (seleno)protein [Xanthobacteraceae bacterium]|nr:YHS domain-containing (seleno)protein [Xanthobacteraceae bacterium]
MLFSLTALAPSAAFAAATERIVVDRYTGLAIGGIDPVAYFTDSEPLPGKADIEVLAEGAVWRFRNEGNRAAFLAAPEVYSPRFGGYDPVGAAEGKAVAGMARLWVIWQRRLYLFARQDNRDAFAAQPERYLGDADRNWPAIQQGLVE